MKPQDLTQLVAGQSHLGNYGSPCGRHVRNGMTLVPPARRTRVLPEV
jgi:hypothetical protein